MKLKKQKRKFFNKKIFPFLAVGVIVICAILVFLNVRTTHNIIVYFPAGCVVDSPSINVTPSKELAFVNAFRTGETGPTITLKLDCGGGIPGDGGYSLESTLTTSNHLAYDNNLFTADASPSATFNTTCNISYSTFEETNNGNRYVLFDCSRLTFKMYYNGKLKPDTQ